MANDQNEKTIKPRDYLKMLKSLEAELDRMARQVERKLGTVWTKIKNLLKGGDEAFALDVIDSFVVDTAAKFMEMAGIVGNDLTASLYGVQQDLYSLKVALIQAAAPLAQALIPLLRQAIGLLTGFAQSIGKVLQSLFGGSAAADSYTESTQAAVAATQALKRSLAGFDQLERLGSSNTGSFFVPDVQEISHEWEAFAKYITELFVPFKKFDMEPAIEGFKKLKAAIEPIGKALFEGLNWAWHNLLVPMAQWAAESLLPAFLELLTQALQSLQQVIEELKPAFMWLWENFLEPLAHWYADKLIEDIKAMTESFSSFSDWVSQASPTIYSIINALDNIGGVLKNVNIQGGGLAAIVPGLSSVMRQFGIVAQELGPAMAILLGGVTGLTPALAALTGNWDVLSGAASKAWESLQNGWSGAVDWFCKQVTEPMEESAKNTANGMIGAFNGMFSSVSNAYGMLSNLINSIHFTFPQWVPGLGGKTLTFSLPPLSLPGIPLLAKGAVLPANKPFLAMVGDQKHGTNVEAPLSTIQEAVMLALEDRLDGVMAGFNAVTERQERILQAIFSLDISDGALAQAVQGYQEKMAAVTGGCV